VSFTIKDSKEPKVFSIDEYSWIKANYREKLLTTPSSVSIHLKVR
jgi:hypothetical protein